jgi:hypothetical protein
MPSVHCIKYNSSIINAHLSKYSEAKLRFASSNSLEDLHLMRDALQAAWKEHERLEVLSPKDRQFELESEPLYEDAKELFGQSFLGIEAVEQSFTLQDGTKLIELSLDEQKEAKRLLFEKMNEPDIKAFLERHNTPEHKESLRKQFILVYRHPKMKIQDQGISVSMKAMQDHLASDMAQKNQGKLFYNVNWYKDEPFYTNTDGKHAIIKPGWSLVTRELIPDSQDKTWDEQTARLHEFLIESGLDGAIRASKAEAVAKNKEFKFDATIYRREAWESMYDLLLILRTTDSRDLSGLNSDWTKTETSIGRHVSVGDFDLDGLGVDGLHSSGAYVGIGACLSR